ncbi:MAG: NADH-quinone oxidoreductase subunit NuoH [Candidatus Accumulibacter sp.]|jgi:NADH-quinone oxidoreductase subunit H|nr:NADH-quinone oxidoreductase subunit NuoH [Accumulibacter sp.]
MIALGKLHEFGHGVFGAFWPSVFIVVSTLIKIACIVAPLMLSVAYLTLLERKTIGGMQARLGPNRVGPFGLAQPLADGLKLLFKEIVIPSGADKAVFLAAPIFSIAPALAAWAVIPFDEGIVLADVNAALLYLMAVTSIGVYGVILAGWSSNSRYAFLGGMRSAAQLISYEIAMGLALIVVLMVSNSLSLGEIVKSQARGVFAQAGFSVFSWNWLSLFPVFVVYMVSIVAETNRAPFDMAEGESEIIGFHLEYSGLAFALFYMAEYASMILCATLAAILFLGGWLSPFSCFPNGFHWLFAKVFVILVFFFWIRATFPRYRYDQVMRLGWKVFIPVVLVWMAVVAAWMMSPLSVWK